MFGPAASLTVLAVEEAEDGSEIPVAEVLELVVVDLADVAAPYLSHYDPVTAADFPDAGQLVSLCRAWLRTASKALGGFYSALEPKEPPPLAKEGGGSAAAKAEAKRVTSPGGAAAVLASPYAHHVQPDAGFGAATAAIGSKSCGDACRASGAFASPALPGANCKRPFGARALSLYSLLGPSAQAACTPVETLGVQATPASPLTPPLDAPLTLTSLPHTPYRQNGFQRMRPSQPVPKTLEELTQAAGAKALPVFFLP